MAERHLELVPALPAGRRRPREAAGCSVGLCVALVLWALVLVAVLVARGAGAGTAPAPTSEPGPPIVQHDYLRHAH